MFYNPSARLLDNRSQTNTLISNFKALPHKKPSSKELAVFLCSSIDAVLVGIVLTKPKKWV
jgi:hypothetical protein